MRDPKFHKFDPSFPKNHLLYEVALIHGDLTNESVTIVAEDENVPKAVVKDRLQKRRKEIEKEIGYKTTKKQMLSWFLSKSSYEDSVKSTSTILDYY